MPANDSEKAVTKTVSMPTGLWDAIDSHANSIDEDRSSYLRRLAQADLTAAGKIPGSTHHEVLGFVEELGVEEAKQILQRALRRRNAA